MTLPDGSTQHIEVAIDVGTECSSLFAPVDCALPPGTVTFGPAHFRQIKKNGSEQTGVPGKVELDFAIAVRGVGVGEGASVGISVVIEGIARAGDRQRGYRRSAPKTRYPFQIQQEGQASACGAGLHDVRFRRRHRTRIGRCPRTRCRSNPARGAGPAGRVITVLSVGSEPASTGGRMSPGDPRQPIGRRPPGPSQRLKRRRTTS